MPNEKPEVVVTDIKIPFWAMVVLMVKWAIAAIPAVVILIVIGGIAGAAMSLFFGTGWQHHWEWMWPGRTL